MDFSWTDEQVALKSAVIEFAKRELNDDLIASDRQGEFSREKWQKCARFGIQGYPLPRSMAVPASTF
jgi:alkylation response protein AidB-like acyl-CoA dehydrogenase